jgi:hypothetical protein
MLRDGYLSLQCDHRSKGEALGDLGSDANFER